MAGDRAGALALIDDDSILSRIEGGENPARIAHSLGVHKSAIYHRFANRPDYQLARKSGMHVRVEEGEDEISDATDPFTLARAREKFRAISWRAEREFPDTWGAKATLDVRVDLGGALQAISERLQERTIDHDATQQLSVNVDSSPQD